MKNLFERFGKRAGKTRGKRLEKVKNNLKQILNKYENIKLIIYLAILCISVMAMLIVGNLDVSKLIELKFLGVFILSYILILIIDRVAFFVHGRLEDEIKLSIDYDGLCGRYSETRKEKYRNVCSSKTNRDVALKRTTVKKWAGNRDSLNRNGESFDGAEDLFEFPETDYVELGKYDVSFVHDGNRTYELPDELRGRYNLIGEAHGHSRVYNAEMIRLDDVEIDDDEGKLTFRTSKTTYFKSLLTNRAMDYRFNGATVRDLYECGPFLSPLRDSRLSNHLGVNGFLETEDKKLVFIIRNDKVSIGKNSIQNSVGAALKTRYAYTETLDVTKDSVVNAIKEEIVDETGIKKSKDYCGNFSMKADNGKDNPLFPGFSFEDNVFGFYRDMVEGGKPQLLFYAKISLPSDRLEKIFSESARPARRKRNPAASADGKRMIIVGKENLDSIYVTPDGLTIDGRFYRAMPASAFSFIKTREYLKSPDP